MITSFNTGDRMHALWLEYMGLYETRHILYFDHGYVMPEMMEEEFRSAICVMRRNRGEIKSYDVI